MEKLKLCNQSISCKNIFSSYVNVSKRVENISYHLDQISHLLKIDHNYKEITTKKTTTKQTTPEIKVADRDACLNRCFGSHYFGRRK